MKQEIGKIFCACGNTLDKDYSKASRIKQDIVLTIHSYLWQCKFCGQEYLEKMSDTYPLILDNKDRLFKIRHGNNKTKKGSR